MRMVNANLRLNPIAGLLFGRTGGGEKREERGVGGESWLSPYFPSS